MYTDELWEEWSSKELRNYQVKKDEKTFLKKGYLHFDHPFWFPDKKDELRDILKNSLIVRKNISDIQFQPFFPFQRILIKTPRYRYQESEGHYGLDTKIRPICFAAHLDGLILGYYGFALNKLYQQYITNEKFDDCVLAYRSDLEGKSNIQFSKEVFDYIKAKGECTAICLDIKGYFDNIEHSLLKKNWCKVLGVEKLPNDQYRIYSNITEYSYVNRNSILKRYNSHLKSHKGKKIKHHTLFDLIPGTGVTEKFRQLKKDNLIIKNDILDKKTGKKAGIPQGSSMSSVLSNIYLIDFDKQLKAAALSNNFLYRRYCDDIVIITSKENASQLSEDIIAKIKTDCHLEIQPKKVEVIHFLKNSKEKIRAFANKKIVSLKTINSDNEKLAYKSMQYLGFEYNGQDVFVRSASLSRYYRKMKAKVIKTISNAYSNNKKKSKFQKTFQNEKEYKIFKKQLFEKYTHLGQRNFLGYVYNASKETYKNSHGNLKDGFGSDAIKKQVSRHFDILMATLIQKNKNRFEWKVDKLEDKKEKIKLKHTPILKKV